MKSFLFLVLSLIPHQVAFSASPTSYDFAWRSELNGAVTTQDFVRIVLDADILKKSHGDMSRLRVFDETEAEVPYAVFEQPNPVPIAPLTVGLKIISFKKTDPLRWDVVLENPKPEESFETLDFDIQGADFQKQITVETSNTLGGWQPLGSGTIYDYTSEIDLRKTSIALAGVSKKYVALRIQSTPLQKSNSGDTLQVNFDRLSVKLNTKTTQAFVFQSVQATKAGKEVARSPMSEVKVVSFAQSQTNENGTSLLLSDLYIPALEIELAVETPFYHRRVTVEGWNAVDRKQTLGSGAIYRLPADHAENAKIRLAGAPLATLNILIQNGNNPALKINEITARWQPQFLYFIADPVHQYFLHIADRAMSRPSYETQNLLTRERQEHGAFPTLQHGAILNNAGFKGDLASQVKPDYVKKGLPFLIGLIVIILGMWAYKLIRSLPPMK